MDDKTKQPGPDDAFKLHAVPEPEETDVAGHMLSHPDDVGPDEGFKFKAVPEPDDTDDVEGHRFHGT